MSLVVCCTSAAVSAIELSCSDSLVSGGDGLVATHGDSQVFRLSYVLLYFAVTTEVKVRQWPVVPECKVLTG